MVSGWLQELCVLFELTLQCAGHCLPSRNHLSFPVSLKQFPFCFNQPEQILFSSVNKLALDSWPVSLSIFRDTVLLMIHLFLQV